VYGTPVVPVSTLRPTLSPASMLVSVAKPAMPSFFGMLPGSLFQAVVPGKQFSRTIALPVAHEAACGVAPAAVEALDAPAPETASTA
jgi:hypothetical protein